MGKRATSDRTGVLVDVQISSPKQPAIPKRTKVVGSITVGPRAEPSAIAGYWSTMTRQSRGAVRTASSRPPMVDLPRRLVEQSAEPGATPSARELPGAKMLRLLSLLALILLL